LEDKAQIPLDAHGCPAYPHPGIGPAIAGSPDVNTNTIQGSSTEPLTGDGVGTVTTTWRFTPMRQ